MMLSTRRRHPSDKNLEKSFTAKPLHNIAQGRAAHPGSRMRLSDANPERVSQQIRGNLSGSGIVKHHAVIHVDGFLYAFSGLTGTWDSVASDTDSTNMAGDYAILLKADAISIFSAITGSWSTARLADVEL